MEKEFYEKLCLGCDAFCITQQLCLFAWAKQKLESDHSLAEAKENQYWNGKNNIVFLERRRRGAQP
jgi:hypothetical protein